MSSAVDSLKGRRAIQRDLESLEKWAHANLTKHEVLQLGQGNPQYQYRPKDEWIKIKPAEKDLGIPLNESLR